MGICRSKLTLSYQVSPYTGCFQACICVFIVSPLPLQVQYIRKAYLPRYIRCQYRTRGSSYLHRNGSTKVQILARIPSQMLHRGTDTPAPTHIYTTDRRSPFTCQSHVETKRFCHNCSGIEQIIPVNFTSRGERSDVILHVHVVACWR